MNSFVVKSTVMPFVGLVMCAAMQSDLSAAESRSQTVELPEIVVTATRTGEKDLDLPYTTDSIGSGDIQSRRLSRTTPEALSEIPAVMLQKTGHGQGSPFIRGFTGFRTLFLIDGIRLNNSVFRDGPNQYWNTVDPFSIDHLELVKGPSSVLYGSDAIGGTVNALSASPLEKDSGGRAYYRHSTAEDSDTLRGEARVVTDDGLGVQAGATHKDFGDLRTGDGKQLRTGYDEVDFDAKVEYLVRPDLRLTLGHQTVEQDDAWRTHKTIYATSFRGTTVGNEKERSLDQNRYLTYVDVDAENVSGLIDELNLTVSHHRQKEEHFRIKKDDSSDITGFQVDTVGVSAQALSRTDAGKWVYGAEFYRDEVDSWTKKFKADGSLKSVGIQGPVADDATYDTLGTYVQDTLSIGDDIELMAGARYNYIEVDAGAFEDPVSGESRSFSQDWDAFVGSARLLYRLMPEGRLNFFAGVSQGFRAPNLSDLTRLDTARTDELETPSPDLDPEQFVAYEVGLKSESENAALECAYFYTDIRDMIVRTPTGRMIDGDNEVTKKNAGDGYVHGIEVNGSYCFLEDWMFWGNLTWMEGEVDTYPTSSPEKKREPVDRLMPLTANVGIRFQPSPRHWMEGVVSAADKQDRLSTRDAADTQRIPPGGTPGYAVFSLRGGWQVSPEIMLTASIENIADKDYRIHGSGLNEPGRNFVVALNYAF
ncbi:MAG: TonB-dependent receptor [Verrucomicrobia bacterium]|nr:TonB-dependent receptor [Verrucomicrobiota bacterium]